jgi:cation transport protein ChaC
MEENWVFGYGSLMWRPGIAYEERRTAMLRGLHRALCVYSHVHRGTPERPGLVLGLDRGGCCRGVAFRIAAARWPETLQYLREREQVTSVYLETTRQITLEGKHPRRVQALAYTVDRHHLQYAGKLPLEEQLRVVRAARGRSGDNPDYVRSTAAHLREMGFRDQVLEWLAERLGEAVTAGP